MENDDNIYWKRYFAAALAMTIIFCAAALIRGGYSPSDITLGAVWVFTLSVIISASVLPRFFNKK